MNKKFFLVSIFVSIFSPLLIYTPVGATSYGNINIISDSVMNSTNTMSAQDIQNFLNSFPNNCLGGNFLTPDPQGYSNGAFQYGQNVNAGQAIYDISNRYNINPQVMIATLEKEQGLIDRNGNCDYSSPSPVTSPTDPNGNAVSCGYQTTYTDCTHACQNDPTGGCVALATGYDCPGYCKKSFNGFSNQLSGAAWSFRFVEARAYGQFIGYPGFDNGDQNINYYGPMVPGYRQRTYNGPSTYYDGTYTDLNGDTMTITNGATASMLSYTPFYANSYLSNRLFLRSFNKWFGSTISNIPISNSLQTNFLTNNFTMHSGDYIISPNGKFTTVLQYDGNLVTYTDNYKAVWSTYTSGNYGDYAIFQNDGNLVLYTANQNPLWSSKTSLTSANKVYLGDDGNLKVTYNDNVLFNSNISVNGAVSSRSDKISSPSTLNGGDYIKSTDGRFTLLMQYDGNLVLYTASQNPLWSTQTFGNFGAYAVMQSDGNLVVYKSNGSPLWSSKTFGNGSSQLKMQSDGNLVIYNSNNIPTWSSGTYNSNYLVNWNIGQSISSQTTLGPGAYLSSSDWRFRLFMQPDGNLVLYSVNGWNPLWSTRTFGNFGAYAVMQSDGNLVVYKSNGSPLWSSKTFGNGSSQLKMQSDGNLVIYNSNNIPTWSSGTVWWF